MTKTSDRSAQELVAGAVDALATVVGSLSEQPTVIAESNGTAEAAWTLALDVSGGLSGSLVVLMPADTATRLARVAAGSGESVSDEWVPKHVSDLWRRTLSELARRPGLEDVIVTIDGCEPARPEDSTPHVAWYAMTVGEDALPLGLHAALDAQPVRTEGPASRASAIPANLDVVLDIDLPLSIRFGHTEMTLANLSRIGPGSVIELDRSPEEPVDILVNGKLVARGEVVVVTGNYGVRVTEVVSAVDRIRSLGA